MILDEIVKRKRKTIQETEFLTKEEYSKELKKLPIPKSFYEAMRKPGLSIIGEIKKASPSKGIIKEEFNPKEIAKEYEKAVDAISVLTEEHFFMGSPQYLKIVSEEVNLPLLRKDFIIDENQIYEARILGASAILLITAILEKEILKKFIETAHSIDLDALVEVHTEEEAYIAIEAGARIIGINNRDLNDFSMNLNTTMRIKKCIPKDILVISESGIHGKKDMQILKGINGILVGECFMVCDCILEKAKEFKDAYEYKD